MIAEVAFFNVSRDDRENDRRVVTALYVIPKGSKVILHLGDRRVAPYELIQHIVRDYLIDLSFEFQGEPHATKAARAYVQELIDPLAG